MRLSRALNDKKMDVRLLDKMMHEGRIEASEVRKYQEGLPDDATNATTTEEVERKKREKRAQSQQQDS